MPGVFQDLLQRIYHQLAWSPLVTQRAPYSLNAVAEIIIMISPQPIEGFLRDLIRLCHARPPSCYLIKDQLCVSAPRRATAARGGEVGSSQPCFVKTSRRLEVRFLQTVRAGTPRPPRFGRNRLNDHSRGGFACLQGLLAKVNFYHWAGRQGKRRWPVCFKTYSSISQRRHRETQCSTPLPQCKIDNGGKRQS